MRFGKRARWAGAILVLALAACWLIPTFFPDEVFSAYLEVRRWLSPTGLGKKQGTPAPVPRYATATGAGSVTGTEPKWRPALAYGGAPRCPEHVGSRAYRSETFQQGQTLAFIRGVSSRDEHGCSYDARAVFDTRGNHREIKLKEADAAHFQIVDFSPDGTAALLVREHEGQYRYIQIAVMRISAGEAEWREVWDLMGWGDCDATVEPQGFVTFDHIALRVRPSVWARTDRRNCVSTPALYVAAFPNGKAERLPDTAVISRNGHPVSGASQPCASDPDVIAACFTVHGRLSLYNGAWTARIWRIGTKRLLGVDDDFPLPWFGAKHVDWGTDVYGDFEVCPFVAEKPGAMQIVCVENGSNLVVKRP